MNTIIIQFTNGAKIKVSEVIAKRLNDIICKEGGSKKFQFFSEAGSDNIILGINVNEIIAIYRIENIL